MKYARFIEHELQDSIDVKKSLLRDVQTIQRIGKSMIKSVNSNHGIFFLGNGGSAADAQHMAAELVGLFGHNIKRAALPATALTTNSSILTAVSNDISFDKVFSRQVEAFVKKGDVVVGISTSGRSKNIIESIKLAKKKGAITVALTGKNKNPLSKIADVSMHAPSNNTQRVQECHITLGHIFCGMIESSLKSDFILTGRKA